MSMLSFVARPFYLESPTSVLIRTAKRNGYQNVWDMCKTLGISVSSRELDLRLKDLPLFNLLCNEAPCLADALREIFYELPAQQRLRGCHIKVQNHDVSTRSLRRQFRSCPVCLKLGYSRDPQDFVFFDFCPAHNVLLTPSCPNCGRVSQWKNICGFTCACGFKLAEAEIIPYRQRLQITIPSSFGAQDASSTINSYFFCEAQKIQIAEPYVIECAPLEQFYAQIEHAIQVDLSTYRQLPVSAFRSIWESVNDPVLRQHAIDYLMENYSTCGPCQRENCCSEIKLSLRQLQYAIGAGVARTRALIAEMSILNKRFPAQNTIAYSHPNLCTVIRAGLDPTRRHCITQRTEEYSSLGTAAALLQTTTTSMAAAVKRGFFPDTLIGDRVYFIPNTSITDFSTRFAFYSDVSHSLNISSRTLNRISSQLNLIPAYDRHLEEPAIYLRDSIDLDRMKEILKNFKIKKSQCSPAIQQLRIIADLHDVSVTVLYHILKTYCECSTPSKDFSPLQRLKLQQWLSAHITLKAAATRLSSHQHGLNLRFIRSNLIKKIDICRVRFITIQSLYFMADHLKKYMSCLEASKLLNISEHLVIDLVKREQLNYTTIYISAKRSQILVEI